MFEDKSVSIPCPKCGHKTDQTIGWLKRHDHFTCSGCGSSIKLDSNQFRTGISDVENSIRDMFKKR